MRDARRPHMRVRLFCRDDLRGEVIDHGSRQAADAVLVFGIGFGNCGAEECDDDLLVVGAEDDANVVGDRRRAVAGRSTLPPPAI